MIYIFANWVFKPLLLMVGTISLIGYYSGQDINLLLDGIVSTFDTTITSAMNIARGQ